MGTASVSGYDSFFKGEPRTAPAFSWTAHTAQGQTLKAAIVDMQIGTGTSPMSSYVAFTRVSKKEDLLIFRPFERELFNQGNQEGPDLLLRVLRGEHIDWAAIEAKHMPSHMCAGCDIKQFKGEFSAPQWKRKDGKRYCKSCEKVLTCDGQRGQCKWCSNWQTEDMFEPSAWRKRDSSQLWCKECKEHRKCRGICGLEKVEWEFNDNEWKHAAWPNSRSGRCKECIRQRQDQRWCSGCEQRLPKDMHFSDKMWKNTSDKKRKCNACSTAACETEVKTQKCNGECQKDLTQTFFSDQQWFRVAADKRKCISCCTGSQSPDKKGQWLCVRHSCRKTLPKALFSLWMKDKSLKYRNNSQVCNQCFVKDRHAEEEQNRKTNSQVQKHQ